MPGLLGSYKNGNAYVEVYRDGTRNMVTFDDSFDFSYNNSCDFKITNSCDGGCAFCHEGSVPQGKHADLRHLDFLNHLHPYTEFALGGGNILEHPDILWLLEKLKEQRVIANITLNQKHFLASFSRVKDWYEKGLVRGIGVSLIDATPQLREKLQEIPTAVLHVINGIFTPDQHEKLKDQGFKLLILGYKDLRRGHDLLAKPGARQTIIKNQEWLSQNLTQIKKGYQVIAFDNLALKQLPVKQNVSSEDWDLLYAGEDGRASGTFYIDGVNEQFALSSTTPLDKRYPIENRSLDEMFQIIKNLS